MKVNLKKIFNISGILVIVLIQIVLKRNFSRFKFLIFSIVILSLTGVFEYRVLLSDNYENEVARFQDVLHKKEKELDKFLLDLENKITKENYLEYLKRSSGVLKNLLKEKGFTSIVYQNDSLKFWSDNSVPVPDLFSESLFENKIVRLRKGWFYILHRHVGDKIIVGLISLKTNYPYENKFLVNEFNKDFNLSPAVLISHEESEQSLPVYSQSGNYLLSLTFTGDYKWKSSGVLFTATFYILGFILLLLFIYSLIKTTTNKRKKLWLFILVAVIFIILKYIIQEFHIPHIIYSQELFTPYIYADTYFFNSLGDLLISSLLVFYFFYLLYRENIIPDTVNIPNRFLKIFVIIILTIPAVVFYVAIHYLFRSLVFNSSISFEVYKVLDISLYTITGFIIIALLFTTFYFLLDKIVLFIKKIFSLEQFFLYYVSCSLLLFLIVSFCCYKIDIISIIFPLVIIAVLGYIRYSKRHFVQYSTIVLFVFLFSVITAHFITEFTGEKENNDRKVWAVNLATEHDLVAELLLEEINEELISDNVLSELLMTTDFNIDDVFNYLGRRYFNGFWNKYEYRITVCSPFENLLVEPDGELFPCYKFFDEKLRIEGSPLRNSNFSFLDNLNGRISYFGSFNYRSDDINSEITLFIELDSKLISEELGYPELLLDNKFDKTSSLTEYSYAKYNNEELISQSGSFPYSLSSEIYYAENEEFSSIKLSGYDHLIYNIDRENIIIVSKPSFKLIDILISFSYIFVFFYLLATIVMLVRNAPVLTKNFELNFKYKIQFSMIGILFLSLLLIGGSTINYSAKQYQNKHYVNISEKTQSVYIELDHKLAYEKELSSDWKSEDYDNLNDLLKKFSNVFFSDINLYDTDGNLMATSRHEIFENGLIGTKMDPEAYVQLVINKRAEFIHNENIGKLNYLSAYVPFMNSENKLLAYLNLPYFTKQSLLTEEISTLAVTIVNIYVLLILLTIAIAVFISNKITQPLSLIQSKFRKIKLGKKNEPIQYSGQDEIGSLVSEYNRMVSELSKNVELLAKSEREMAWREMAKQIAHEIKNPLTPMKLSVQHLQRAWNDKLLNWDEYLEKFIKTLIEQIDNLSTIASEFSNFAQMPKTNNEEVNIIDKIKNSVSLFDKTENIDFILDLEKNDMIVVFADKEQLIRVFINLIKNSVQSIQKGIKGLIKISLEKKEKTVIVSITDNGRGVPEELGDKLFMPNFTTKSGGMGLGLAIAKNIVEQSGGNIWYKTRIGKGTTFFVELPIYIQ